MSADKTVGEQPERRRRLLGGKSREELREDAASGERAVAAKAKTSPARRERDEDEKKPGGIQGLFITLRNYVEGVQSEIRKVVWPTREDTQRLTRIVLTTLILSSLALGAIVLLFTELFRIGLQNPIILIVVMAIAGGAGVAFARISSRRAAS